jgi:hypothetical protein
MLRRKAVRSGCIDATSKSGSYFQGGQAAKLQTLSANRDRKVVLDDMQTIFGESPLMLKYYSHSIVPGGFDVTS